MNRNSHKKYIFILILIILYEINNVQALRLKLTKLVCNVLDKSFARLDRCRVKAVSRNEQYYTMYLKFLQLPITEMQLRLRFMKKANGFKPFLYDFTFRCDFQKHLNAVTSIVWRWFTEVTTLNHSCPITEDFEIPRLENTYFQNELNFLPLLNGEYGFFADFGTDNITKFHAEFHALIY